MFSLDETAWISAGLISCGVLYLIGFVTLRRYPPFVDEPAPINILLWLLSPITALPVVLIVMLYLLLDCWNCNDEELF